MRFVFESGVTKLTYKVYDGNRFICEVAALKYDSKPYYSAKAINGDGVAYRDENPLNAVKLAAANYDKKGN